MAAYCRVSIDQEEQLLSYENQVNYYTNYISENPPYEYAGTYADEGISGTNTKKRDEFNRMIADCRAGKIDMIITKSISRFARNTLDCLNYVRELKDLGIGIIFEKENINTLDAKGEVLLTILSSLAQDESRSILKLAQEHGFLEFDKFGKALEPGDKVYYFNREKAIILAVKGKRPICDGVRISAAHIDSPRLDLKQCPVYEDGNLGFFKTHYYGGIKKYQWTAIPLSLHGRICKNDGTYVDVKVGEDPADPKFCITDILPHLGAEQMSRKANEIVKGEELNVVIGSRPFKDDEVSEKIKLNLLNILFEKYGIVERDFLSAELELVPAFSVDDIGFDRSLIGGYGHDDRVCSYPALQAILDIDEAPEYTALTVLTDKEETGSDGNTGLNSSYLKSVAFILTLMSFQARLFKPRTS